MFGFEAIYLAVAVLLLSSELRRYAQRIALAAVTTAVVLNTIADYQAHIPDGLKTWATFRSSFDGLALGVSLIERLPLAGVAFAMATLLHRLAEVEQPHASAPPCKPVLSSSLFPMHTCYVCYVPDWNGLNCLFSLATFLLRFIHGCYVRWFFSLNLIPIIGRYGDVHLWHNGWRCC